MEMEVVKMEVVAVDDAAAEAAATAQGSDHYEKIDNKPAEIVTVLSSGDAGMMDDSIAGQWWLPHRRTPLWQMRTGKNMKIKKATINQENASKRESPCSAQPENMYKKFGRPASCRTGSCRKQHNEC